MRTDEFDYILPKELIAQVPSRHRDASHLLIFSRSAPERCEHRLFRDLPDYLNRGDLLVLNDTRVIPARLWALLGDRRVEVLLLRENGPEDWWGLLRPGRKVKIGAKLAILDHAGRRTAVEAWVAEKNVFGQGRLIFSGGAAFRTTLERFGHVPLPPYIVRKGLDETAQDRARYQTVYAREEGSIAAPTAGLHFTRALLGKLRGSGVGLAYLTLHIGLGTFAPVKVMELEEHVMHSERFSIPASTAAAIQRTKAGGGRIVAVGTSVLRALETSALESGEVRAMEGWTNLFIHPPYKFRAVDGLLTNFHLPRSTLLMLVSAFAAPGETGGTERILRAYGEAIAAGYRFFSYGDAMLMMD